VDVAIVYVSASFTVQVGQGTNLVFSPNTVTASPGDTVVFTWGSSISHSATQGTFDNPCTKDSNSSAFDSGVKSSGSVTYTVKDTNPVWLHCSIPGHCPTGMVAAINPPTSGSETFQAYQAKAEGKSVSSSSSGTTTSSTNTGSSTTSSSSPAYTSKKNGAAAAWSISSLGLLGTVGTVATLIGSVVFAA